MMSMRKTLTVLVQFARWIQNAMAICRDLSVDIPC